MFCFHFFWIVQIVLFFSRKKQTAIGNQFRCLHQCFNKKNFTFTHSSPFPTFPCDVTGRERSGTEVGDHNVEEAHHSSQTRSPPAAGLAGPLGEGRAKQPGWADTPRLTRQPRHNLNPVTKEMGPCPDLQLVPYEAKLPSHLFCQMKKRR